MWASGWNQSVSDLTTADSGQSALWPEQLGLFPCVRCKSRILRSLPAAFPNEAPPTLCHTWTLPDAAAGACTHLYFKASVDDLMPPVWMCDRASDGEVVFLILFLFILSKVFSVQRISAMFKHSISVQVCVFTCLQMPIKPNYYRAVIVVCGPHCDLRSQNLDGA